MQDPAQERSRKPRPFAPCPYCGVRMQLSGLHYSRDNQMTRHHIIAKRFGGGGLRHNIRWCCRTCNEGLVSFNECPAAMSAWATVGTARGYLGPMATRARLALNATMGSKRRQAARKARWQQ